MASHIAALAGWAILPSLVTGYAQSILYSVIIRAGEPKPAPGSKRFIRDRKRIQICVILAYLAYTIVDAEYQLRAQGDFYQALGVPHDASEKSIQSRFRRLTVQFHPDKVTGPDKSAIEAIYVQFKLARDTLVDPAKRFAYDRFGPDILLWRQCKTLRDFVIHGMQQLIVYYGITTGIFMLIGTFGYYQSGKYWRYWALAVLFAIEMYFITLSTHPPFLTDIVNPFLSSTRYRSPYLPFLFILLLRKLAVTFFIALTQLGPLLQDTPAGPNSDAISPQQLNNLDTWARLADMEVSRLTALDLTPFATQEPSLTTLRSTLKEWMVRNTVRSDPEVSTAIAQALNRRREQTNA